MNILNLVVRMFAFALLFVFVSITGARAQVATKPATDETKQANAALLQKLPFADKADFENAKRGFIATVPGLTIKDD